MIPLTWGGYKERIWGRGGGTEWRKRKQKWGSKEIYNAKSEEYKTHKNLTFNIPGEIKDNVYMTYEGS